MYSLVILAIILCAHVVLGQGDSDCTTPTGIDGFCISLNDCDKLKPLIKKSAEEREYLKQWHCGFDNDIPRVCCPPVAKKLKRCGTESGKIGVCVALETCPELAKLLNKPFKKENVEYVQKSRCLGDTKYDVCCEQGDNTQLEPDTNLLNSLFGLPSDKNHKFTTEKPISATSTSDRVVQFSCTSSATLPDPKKQCCGVDSISGNKIIGGLEAAIDAYPWLAIIEYSRDYLCGGSLISGKYVLTAAHCIVGITNKPRGAKNVILGEYDISNPGIDCAVVDGGGIDCTNGSISIPIESTIVHPGYNSEQSVIEANDIALIRLTEMAPYTEFIRPICLPEDDVTAAPPPNLFLYVAGWGAVSEKKSRSDKKLYIDLPLVDHESCSEKYSIRGKSILWDKQICAGGVKQKDSCKGDSGGPLSNVKDNYQELIGVISFGVLQCGSEGKPSVYTKVYEYVPWIRSNIKP